MLRKIGCLVVLLAGLVAGWFVRDRWVRPVGGDSARAAAESPWEPLTLESAARARDAIAVLARRDGPPLVTLRAGELGSFVYQALRPTLPPSADSLEAAAIGDRLYVRASVKLSDLGGEQVLGPLAGFLGERERMQFGGTFRIVRPGFAEFQVREIKLRELPVPGPAIPRVLRQLWRGTRPEGLSDDGLPLVIPRHISDVRIVDRVVTLYKPAP
ncbi:MAG TPA: hypothetical protein VNA89_10690 [Gemmatimonadaceae bacterium]|nr:hypothetical protein [Gemmatimonadaceae bacterium]